MFAYDPDGRSMKDIVRIAEELCLFYHEGQHRKAGNQKPYAVHPFAVRDLLVKYGYDDPEVQAASLIHDTVEDTVLVRDKRKIEKQLGLWVYNAVYALSNNTLGKHAEAFAPLLESMGVPFYDASGQKLSPEAYKIRLLFSNTGTQLIKIGDMSVNTDSLPDLSKKGIEKKITDAESFYIPMGMAIAPIMTQELIQNINDYKRSEHYIQTFGN